MDNKSIVRFFSTYGILVVIVAVATLFLYQPFVDMINPPFQGTPTCVFNDKYDPGSRLIVNGHDMTATDVDFTGDMFFLQAEVND